TLNQDVTIEASTLDLAQVAINSLHAACGIDHAGTLWCWTISGGESRFNVPPALFAGAQPVRIDPDNKYRAIAAAGLSGGLAEHCGVTLTLQMRCWAFIDDGPTAVRDVATPV